MPLDKNIIAIWKPKGPTSFGVIYELRKITGIKKIGHAGTLDPLAEGILIIGLGREGTKQMKNLVGEEKEYIATIQLGTESTTHDEEGEKSEFAYEKIPQRADVEMVVKKFIGHIEQAPPIFSALKIKGKPAYKLARAGKEVILSPRQVFIKEIEILEYAWPILKIKVTTGPGVYIRSLARDIGKELQTGGYLIDLIRTRVGNFKRENCELIELTWSRKKEE
jgi:tRNA pseudouridine55 synthase